MVDVVPSQVDVVAFHVCPTAQRCHVKPVFLCKTVPSLLMVKSSVGVSSGKSAAKVFVANAKSNNGRSFVFMVMARLKNVVA